MADPNETGSRAAKIADVLRPLGRGPLSKQQAVLAADLLGVHWTTVYRLRRRFLADPVASAVAPQRRGPSTGGRRLGAAVDNVIDEVVQVWLPTQRQLAHPATDLVLEVRRRCALAGLQLPSRTTIGRRWAQHREADALKRAALPDALTAPGSLVAKFPLDIVQVDHTQADVLLVSEYDRQVIPSLGDYRSGRRYQVRVELFRRHGPSGSGNGWFAPDESGTMQGPLACED